MDGIQVIKNNEDDVVWLQNRSLVISEIGLGKCPKEVIDLGGKVNPNSNLS